jgi:predicted acyl esterase
MSVSNPGRQRPEILFRPARSPEDPGARYAGLHPGEALLPAGSVVKTGARALSCDIHVRRDVAVPLRDGTTIYVDIFEPVGGARRPTIVGWGPYGKRNGVIMLDDIPTRAGIPVSWQSGLEMFEGPDPAYWCAHGYVVVNADARGVFSSGGDIRFWGRQEGADGADLVEWIAAQDWSNGKVGLTGTSWLAIVQWFIAAERPAHLTAIAPWEGWTDLYRCDAFRGGIPDIGFNEHMTSLLAGRGKVEDVPAMVRGYPLMNDYWKDKIPDLGKIEIPSYVVGSWTNLIHAIGTLNGFIDIPAREKWLRVHNSHEWTDYYAEVEDLRRFFDRYLKGEENGWEQTPRVRLAVLDPGRKDVVNRPEAEFPLTRTVYKPLYLDAGSRTIGDNPAEQGATATYRSDDPQDRLIFTYRFDKDTELAGYFALRLWVEACDADDTDIYVEVRKLYKSGRRAIVRNIRHPNRIIAWVLEQIYRRGKAQFGMMFFSGAKGMQRASHRAIDPDRSSPGRPHHTHESIQPLQPGDVVPVDIQIWPLAMKWRKGEQIQLLIAGSKMSTAEMPGLIPPDTINKGTVKIHTGGRYDSCLTVPVTG